MHLSECCRSIPSLDLLGEDYIVLVQFINTLGVIMHASVNAAVRTVMLKSDWQPCTQYYTCICVCMNHTNLHSLVHIKFCWIAPIKILWTFQSKSFVFERDTPIILLYLEKIDEVLFIWLFEKRDVLCYRIVQAICTSCSYK